MIIYIMLMMLLHIALKKVWTNENEGVDVGMNNKMQRLGKSGIRGAKKSVSKLFLRWEDILNTLPNTIPQ